MDPSRKRFLGEGSSNGGDSSNLQLVPHSGNKKVCRYCKREFNCGRGLGGHIKIHSKGGKMTKFSRAKMNKRRGFRSFLAPPPLRRNRNVRGGEITDLSKFLFGSGWKVQKKRGTNEARGKEVVVASDSSSDDDSYIECDDDDSCDEDDYDSIRLRKKLRRRGINGNAHKICWTKRMLMCKVCDQFFRTYYALLCHVSEYLPINVKGGEKVNEEKGEEVGQVASGEEHEGDAEGGVEASEKEKQGKEDVVMGDNNEGFGGVEEGEKESGEKGEVGEAAAAEKHEGDAEGCIEVGEKEEQGKEDVVMGDNNEGFDGVEEGEKGEKVDQVVDEAAAAEEHEGDAEDVVMGDNNEGFGGVEGEKENKEKGEKENEEKGEEVEQVVGEAAAAEEREGDAEGGIEIGEKEGLGKADVVMGDINEGFGGVEGEKENGEKVDQVVDEAAAAEEPEGAAEGCIEVGEKKEQGKEDVVMGEKENEEKGEEVEQVVDEAAAAEEHEGDAKGGVEVGEKEEQGKEVVMGDNNDEDFRGVEEGMETKKSNEVAEVGETSGGDGGGSKDQKVSASVAPPKMLDFDLNEMPPEEED